MDLIEEIMSSLSFADQLDITTYSNMLSSLANAVNPPVIPSNQYNINGAGIVKALDAYNTRILQPVPIPRAAEKLAEYIAAANVLADSHLTNPSALLLNFEKVRNMACLLRAHIAQAGYSSAYFYRLLDLALKERWLTPIHFAVLTVLVDKIKKKEDDRENLEKWRLMKTINHFERKKEKNGELHQITLVKDAMTIIDGYIFN